MRHEPNSSEPRALHPIPLPNPRISSCESILRARVCTRTVLPMYPISAYCNLTPSTPLLALPQRSRNPSLTASTPSSNAPPAPPPTCRETGPILRFKPCCCCCCWARVAGVEEEAAREEGRGFGAGAGGGAEEKEGEKEKDASRVI